MPNLFFPQFDYTFFDVLDTNGVAANTVVLDTGALDAGSYEVRAAVDGNCSQAARFVCLVILGTDGSTVVRTLRRQNCYFSAAKSPIHFERVRVEEGQKLAWRMGTEAYTDILSADIAIRRVA